MTEPTAGPPTEHRAGLVALVGWTNVGKSTLLNRLVGSPLAAVAPVAQTTRHRIMGARNLPGGQIVLVDTPGLHRPRHRMNRAMVEVVRQTLRSADLALLVLDASHGIGPGDREALQSLRDDTPRMIALNKIDLVSPKSRLLPMMQEVAEVWGFHEVFAVSGRSGDGCAHLLEQLCRALPPGPPLFEEDFLTDQSQRTLAAERIREKLIRLTRQELPHATAVWVENWVEREDGLLEIDAAILVDRDSQKPIVIGRGGRMLKEVGSEARVDLERMLGRRVHLRLWVKVSADWRDDPQVLRRLGLE